MPGGLVVEPVDEFLDRVPAQLHQRVVRRKLHAVLELEAVHLVAERRNGSAVALLREHLDRALVVSEVVDVDHLAQRGDARPAHLVQVAQDLEAQVVVLHPVEVPDRAHEGFSFSCFSGLSRHW